MRKILAWFSLVIFTYVLVCASSDSTMKWLSQQRDMQLDVLRSDKYTFGDLYGFSYLPQFRIIKDSRFVDLPSDLDTNNRNKDLYILCDSYLYSSFDEKSAYFSGIKNAYFTRWTEETLVNSNKLKASNSVLLIECVERNAIFRLNVSEVKTRIRITDSIKKQRIPQVNHTKFLTFHDINEGVKSLLYHPTLETNLDFTLFGRGIYRIFKELKASLNLQIFHRIDNSASLSKDGSFLYLKETVDPNLISSSFYAFNHQEITNFVANLNEINQYYQQAGFKKVLISIPANPVAILQTEELPTNDLLNRLKNHPNLKVEIVDPSDSLKVNAPQNYFKSDSHWNNNGAKIWLAYLNRSLEKI